MRTIKLTDIIDVDNFVEDEEEIKLYLPNIKAINKRATKKYQSKEIQEKAQVSAIQISHWTRTGAIIPAVPVRGTGKMHVYDHQNLIEAMICRELSQYSINYGVMREALKYLRSKEMIFSIQITGKTLTKILKYPEIFTEIDTEYGLLSKRLDGYIDEEYIHDERSHTIWEYFKNYPPTVTIHFFLWKDSTNIEFSEPKTGEYNMHLTSLGAYDILSRCPSAIVINLTLLLLLAGSFYEEVES